MVCVVSDEKMPVAVVHMSQTCDRDRFVHKTGFGISAQSNGKEYSRHGYQSTASLSHSSTTSHDALSLVPILLVRDDRVRRQRAGQSPSL